MIANYVMRTSFPPDTEWSYISSEIKRTCEVHNFIVNRCYVRKASGAFYVEYGEDKSGKTV